jgi:hypothetical protein
VDAPSAPCGEAVFDFSGKKQRIVHASTGVVRDVELFAALDNAHQFERKGTCLTKTKD